MIKEIIIVILIIGFIYFWNNQNSKLATDQTTQTETNSFPTQEKETQTDFPKIKENLDDSKEQYYQIITPLISRENLDEEKINFPDHSPVKFQEEVVKGIWFCKHSLNPIKDYKRLMTMSKKGTRKFMIKFKNFNFLEGFFLKTLVITGADLLSIQETSK